MAKLKSTATVKKPPVILKDPAIISKARLKELTLSLQGKSFYQLTKDERDELLQILLYSHGISDANGNIL